MPVNRNALIRYRTIDNCLRNRQPPELCYQSFKARQPNTFHFHGYYLKEYRNRWFVIGVRKKEYASPNTGPGPHCKHGRGEGDLCGSGRF